MPVHTSGGGVSVLLDRLDLAPEFGRADDSGSDDVGASTSHSEIRWADDLSFVPLDANSRTHVFSTPGLQHVTLRIIPNNGGDPRADNTDETVAPATPIRQPQSPPTTRAPTVPPTNVPIPPPPRDTKTATQQPPPHDDRPGLKTPPGTLPGSPPLQPPPANYAPPAPDLEIRHADGHDTFTNGKANVNLSVMNLGNTPFEVAKWQIDNHPPIITSNNAVSLPMIQGEHAVRVWLKVISQLRCQP